MKKILFAVLAVCVIILSGCQESTGSPGISSVILKDDLSIETRLEQDDDHKFTVTKLSEVDEESEDALKINVENQFLLRCRAKVEPGKRYKISFTMKNESADPIIRYTFWKKPGVSKRSLVLQGDKGNPNKSKTQEIYNKWTTFSEIFEAQEGEDLFVLSLSSKKGVFYIKDISIEKLQ